MFITNSRSGYLGGDQYASGLFLMVFCNEQEPRVNSVRPLRALVRKVALRQFGHFMMGRVTLLGQRVSLSGSYGHDGLPLDASPELWQRLHPLPGELSALFWKGDGGHNSAGSEGPALRAWALANVEVLRHLREKQP